MQLLTFQKPAEGGVRIRQMGGISYLCQLVRFLSFVMPLLLFAQAALTCDTTFYLKKYIHDRQVRQKIVCANLRQTVCC